jgi:hypothetical protein
LRHNSHSHPEHAAVAPDEDHDTGSWDPGSGVTSSALGMEFLRSIQTEICQSILLHHVPGAQLW